MYQTNSSLQAMVNLRRIARQLRQTAIPVVGGSCPANGHQCGLQPPLNVQPLQLFPKPFISQLVQGVVMIRGFQGFDVTKIRLALSIIWRVLDQSMAHFLSLLPTNANRNLIHQMWQAMRQRNIIIVADAKLQGTCGRACLVSPHCQHSITVYLGPGHVRSDFITNIALTLLHEIGHQFGISHGGGLNYWYRPMYGMHNYDLELALAGVRGNIHPSWIHDAVRNAFIEKLRSTLACPA